jgi:hypothetical protein
MAVMSVHLKTHVQLATATTAAVQIIWQMN